MLHIQIRDAEVKLWLANMPASIRQRLEDAIYGLTERLRTHVVRDKLVGQVLNRRTGRLGQSIQSRIENARSHITGYVYSSGDVKYAAIHEYGGRTPPHVILPKNKKALHFNGIFATRVNHPGSQMPERSFLRSSLADMKNEIMQRMERAVIEGMKQ